MSIDMSDGLYGRPKRQSGHGSVPYLKLVYSFNEDLVGEDDGEPERAGSFVVAILAVASASMFAAVWLLIHNWL
ncbi:MULTISPECIES: hypothetical protein [Rhizobium]|jgi:hypothetical protein|uniref:Uncharacterized protein n=1 Tax=Rhizobium wenxiniae TaxID=1737357 RepID=A0A7W9Y1U0_9HYPH|nr:hypothetical protein [Rhizobium wenxiniae]MBB6160355.1 hypothetical protein [Rhizobium wenxiniae]GGF80896.1 hypothetical protein GCM10010924_05040 [Rhizobium wenxiniae]